MAKRSKIRKAPVKRPGRKKRVRVAIIGAGGRAAGTHYPCLTELPGCDVVACCDVDEDRLHSVADRFNIEGRFRDYRRMIEEVRPDAVYAIMPPYHIFDVAVTVLEMKCHLFIEKPPAVTTEQIRQLARLARDNRVLTGVTFQRRFSPLIRHGKALCEERGEVHTAHASFYKNWIGGAPYYKGAMDMLTCDGIHAVDTLRYLCGGEVESVASDNRRLDAEHWNVHLAMVRFSSGATGLLLNNFMAGRRMFSVEIHSPGISFFGDPEEEGQLFSDNQREPLQRLDPFELADSTEPHRAFGAWDVNEHFIDCVRWGREPETNFADAVKTMALVNAIYSAQI
ncbi:MAG: Gfo/Idh/MocA family oxidoreductase [Candidatus Latescibacterota bacterium]|nr:Gfo/Idh/MocA family oxidoreductase [Candidatus Latescibacterota bacterium]